MIRPPTRSPTPTHTMNRRIFLELFSKAGAVAPFIGSGLLRPGQALAVDFNRAPFEAKTAADVLRLTGTGGAEATRDIFLKVPEVAENGASVPIEIASNIPGTTRLMVIIDKNPLPLALQFNFGPEAVPRLQTRLRMAESSRLRIVATAAGKHYTVFRDVKVTVGGCGD